MIKSAAGQPASMSPSVKAGWSTFWAMVRKELILIARYPINFIASFGQIFLIVAIFTLGSRTFSGNLSNPSSNGPVSGNNPSGVVIYGFILFMFISDTLWTIGYNVRHEQVQGTLEQLYLSPASKFASLVDNSTFRPPSMNTGVCLSINSRPRVLSRGSGETQRGAWRRRIGQFYRCAPRSMKELTKEK